MFKNVVSTQELLSDSQRTNYSSDSALFSLSQKQRSQNEFSQVRTQDLFTQNPSTESQSENSFSISKKPSMYDKWMSKAMLKKDQSALSTRSGQPSFQQHRMNQNKKGDTDDKELMQEVVNIVQECSKEVKNVLNHVKEKIESQSDLTTEKLGDIMKAFLEDIWKHEDRMLKAVEERDQNKSRVHELEKQVALVTSQSKEKQLEIEKQLAVKDAEIKHLQSQLDGQGQKGDLQQMAKAVRQEMLSPQLAMENKLMEILEVTREASEQQSEQLNQYKHQMTAHNQQYSEWKAVNQRYLKDMEKRLQKDIVTLRKDLQKQEKELQTILQDQLTEINATQMQDIENLIEKAIAESTECTSKQWGMDGKSATSYIVENVKKDVQNAINRQSTNTEKEIQKMFSGQLQKQKQQLQTFHKTLLAALTSEIESTKETGDSSVAQLTVPVFEERFDEYQTDLKHQLEEMHAKHMQEVKSLQRREVKLQDKGPSSVQSSTPKPIAANEGYVQRVMGYKLNHKEDLRIMSPLSCPDKSRLFSNHKPTPDASIFSEDHYAQFCSSQEMPRNISSDEAISFKKQKFSPEVELQSKANQVTKKKKQRAGQGFRKKKSKKKAKKFQEINQGETTASVQKTQAGPANPTRSENSKLKIYDFSQELSPKYSLSQTYGFTHQKGLYPRNQLYSPDISTASGCSSPAVSIKVDTELVKVNTELVMVRRSRWKTSSLTQQMLAKEPFDMLSKPCSRMSSQKDQAAIEYTQPRTRSGRKKEI